MRLAVLLLSFLSLAAAGVPKAEWAKTTDGLLEFRIPPGFKVDPTAKDLTLINKKKHFIVIVLDPQILRPLKERDEMLLEFIDEHRAKVKTQGGVCGEVGGGEGTMINGWTVTERLVFCGKNTASLTQPYIAFSISAGGRFFTAISIGIRRAAAEDLIGAGRLREESNASAHE